MKIKLYDKKIMLLFGALILIATRSHGQEKPPVNWQLMDWKQDGYPGISLEKAYHELLKNKKPRKKIVIAVIDQGLDTTHPDLAGIQWTNKGEIPNNGIDDDHNGFIDDIHGWNFEGNAVHETTEAVREYVRLRGKYENIRDTVALAGDPGYSYWKKVLAEKNRIYGQYIFLNSLLDNIAYTRPYLRKLIGKDSMCIGDIRHLSTPEGSDSLAIKLRTIKEIFASHPERPDNFSIDSVEIEIRGYLSKDSSTIIMQTVIDKNDSAYFRKKELGDDPYDNNGNHYGNNNTFYTFPGLNHATDIDGIIAAVRGNGLGGDGITNSVEIMTIVNWQFNANSDEWDKDVANCIKYAVANGAQIVSMSFGKYLSPQQEWVVEAMKYAEQKGVLLVGAAGNDANDNDTKTFYPFAYSNENILSNLIKVGASTWDSTLVANFSNYGYRSVDVFAPGVDIYTTSPGAKYVWAPGTSFSTPMVAGTAAFIWSYYPKFNYRQVKYCIEHSVEPIGKLVTKPGTKERVPFKSLCRTGGIVNAYNAIKIAEDIDRGKIAIK